MIDFLLELDRELFLLLNGFHAAWLDPVMLFITDKLSSIPLYIFLAYVLVREFGKQSWLAFLCIALTVVLADQVTTTIMKPYFARLRPSQEPELSTLIHLVNGYKGSRYGFASSHAANTFGVAMFLFLLLSPKVKWGRWLFVWATVVAYSRIYLGVHYPGDVIVGALVGMIAGFVCYRLFLFSAKKFGSAHSSTGHIE